MTFAWMDSRDTAMAGPELTLLGMNFGVPTDACEAGIGGLSTAGTATADRQAEPCTAVRWMSSTTIVCKAAPIKDWNPVGRAARTHSPARAIASLPLVGNAHHTRAAAAPAGVHARCHCRPTAWVAIAALNGHHARYRRTREAALIAQLVTVSVNGRASAYSGFYAYAAPYVTEASALNSAVTGGVRLTLSGINFGVADPTPFVRLGGARVPPNRRPHPPLSASAPAPPLMHSAHSPLPQTQQCRKWLRKCSQGALLGIATAGPPALMGSLRRLHLHQ